MAPHISIRESIRWEGEAAQETTSTIVLTTEDAWFVDVRILVSEHGQNILRDGYSSPRSTRLDSPPHQAAIESPPFLMELGSTLQSTAVDPPSQLTGRGYPVTDLPMARLEWAFAGFSHFANPTGRGSDGEAAPALEDEDAEAVPVTQWDHLIDSTTRDAEDIVDKGQLWGLENGLTLERGEMVNPRTGELQKYEELWRDVTPLPVGMSRVYDDETVTPPSEARFAMMLWLLDEDDRTDGMIVRVGQYCQGIMRVGDDVFVERWAWTANGGWKCEARFGGEDMLPCHIVIDNDHDWQAADPVSYKGHEWRVNEAGRF